MNTSTTLMSFKDKSVLITGGCGFIGSHLLRKLLSLKVARVVIIDSMQFGHDRGEEYDDERVTIMRHNIGTDPVEHIAPLFKEIDIIFHLAAQKHNQSLNDNGAVYRENIFGTSQIYELSGENNVSCVVFSSSLYAHGSYHNPAMSENDIPEPRTAYGISKLAGEHLLKMYGAKYGFQHVALRFFFVYGPRQFPGMGYKSVIIKNFERIIDSIAPIIYGDGTQRLDYLYVDDVIDALLCATKPEVNGKVFHIGSGNAISILELTKAMLSISKYSGDLLFEPADWTAGMVRGTSTDLAKSELGWSATTSLHDGLSKTFDWMKSYENK